MMTAPPPIIRQAVISDAPALHNALIKLAAHLGTEGKITSTVEDIRHHGFSATPAFTALVAEVSGTCAGVCIYFPVFSTWMGRLGVYVQDLYVDPAFRGYGLGDALLRRVAAASATQGATHLRLSVDATNIAAQGFYTTLGLVWLNEERIFAVRGEMFALLSTPAQNSSLSA
jgi:ribosomal protein S18 acetylase RimI-like enzyme